LKNSIEETKVNSVSKNTLSENYFSIIHVNEIIAGLIGAILSIVLMNLKK